MSIKKVVALNDICAYGKASLTISIPIFSKLAIQTCPLPTVLLSSHTQFPSFCAFDLSEQLLAIIEEWKKLNLKFDGFYIGYMLGEKQNDIAKMIAETFDIKSIIIDPILGDNGKLYAGFYNCHVERMKSLISIADIITPNITEAALLLGQPYSKNIDINTIKNWAKRLNEYGAKKVVITSVEIENKIGALTYNDGNFNIFMSDKADLHIPGTGDAFSTSLYAYYLNGLSFEEAVSKSVEFVANAVNDTLAKKEDAIYGLNIENKLHFLD